MNTITFDKLAYVDTLKSSGINEEHARVHANALDSALRETVATKQDIAAARTELKEDIAAVRTELKGDIAAVRTELKEDIAKLDVKITGVKVWMMGQVLALVGVMIALRFIG